MSALRALSVAFRELRAPELEAARTELAEVKARLEDVEDKLRHHYKARTIELQIRDRYRRRNALLESENKRLREYAEERQTFLSETMDENIKLCQRLSKGRKTQDTSTQTGQASFASNRAVL